MASSTGDQQAVAPSSTGDQQALVSEEEDGSDGSKPNSARICLLICPRNFVNLLGFCHDDDECGPLVAFAMGLRSGTAEWDCV